MNNEGTSFLIDNLISFSSNWIIRPESVKEMKYVIRKYKDSNNQKGKLGEIYVKDNLRYQFRELGFKQSYKVTPMSYYMKYQYRHKKKGIDIYLRIVDENSNIYKVMIEVCNWMKMHSINNYILNNRILDKFKKFDRLNRNYHMIAINQRNVRLIKNRCDNANALILPLREHITSELIQHLEQTEQL